MTKPVASPPELLPILSRGRHRNPRKGACFMELASVLAGERWSDHPPCTHPLLAHLARIVNDCTSDDHRHELAVLIPSVVGLTSDDPRVDARIALRCATTALPVAAESRQGALAVGVLTADCVLAGLDGRLTGDLEPASRTALGAAPGAARWANEFVRRGGIAGKGFRRHAAPTMVRVGAQAIAEACVPDPDALLRDLLTGAVQDCERLVRPTQPAPAAEHAEV